MTFDTNWRNWSGYWGDYFFPRRVFLPAVPADIAKVIAKAVADARHVRAPGSHWSFSDVAATSDYVLATSLEFSGNLHRILGLCQKGNAWGHPDGEKKFHCNLSPVLPAALLANILRSSRRFAHIGAGVTIEQLYKALDEPQFDSSLSATCPKDSSVVRGRWALPTMGGAAKQSVVGAVATSTHGGDFDVPPLQEMVRAIHLIDANGNQRWLEGAGTRSITDPKKLAQFLPGVTAHYDDDLFLSTVVSMGCFGTIYSLVIEVVDQYGLTQTALRADWPVVRDWLKGDTFTTTSLDGSTPAPKRFLEILINPYRTTDDYTANDPDASRTCFLALRDSFATPPFSDNPVPKGGAVDQLDFFLHKVIPFKAHGQGTARVLIDEVIKELLLPGRPPVVTPTTSHLVMDTYGGPLPVQSVEFAISTRDDQHVAFLSGLMQAFDEVCRADPDNKFAGGFAVRFTLPTAAMLGIQEPRPPDPHVTAKERICHVELITLQALPAQDPAAFEGKTGVFVRRFEEVAAMHGAHMHWGMLSITDRHSPDRYLRFADWIAARQKLAGSSRVFDSDFTVRYGLSPSAKGWAVLSGRATDLSYLSGRASEVKGEVVMGHGLLPGSPTSHDDDAKPAHRYPPTAFRSARGDLEVVVLGADGQACWNRQIPGVWSGWQVIPGNEGHIKDEPQRRKHFVGRIAYGMNSDGHPEIFATCGKFPAGSRIFHAWRSNPQADHWDVQDHGFNVRIPASQWSEMDTDEFASSPDVALDGDRHLHLIARTLKNRIFRRCQNPTGWSGWEELKEPPQGVTFDGDPAIVAGNKRVLTVVCRDTANQMWFSRQFKPESGAGWSDWAKLGAKLLFGDPVAVADHSAKIRVFAAGQSPSGGNALFQIAEVTANSTWQPIGPRFKRAHRPKTDDARQRFSQGRTCKWRFWTSIMRSRTWPKRKGIGQPQHSGDHSPATPPSQRIPTVVSRSLSNSRMISSSTAGNRLRASGRCGLHVLGVLLRVVHLYD